ncbi:protein PELPK1 [Arachis duranensis]|uniref:Protein PELPK1 n=1 Tax=Arachis duranensis TaxID=130453 RepID=A0A6P4C4Z4_ARADU|nr:protein PELPK1 [Arachis duranensis]XP_057738616.1 protein PELPK1-like [Arachis stenosperma]
MASFTFSSLLLPILLLSFSLMITDIAEARNAPKVHGTKKLELPPLPELPLVPVVPSLLPPLPKLDVPVSGVPIPELPIPPVPAVPLPSLPVPIPAIPKAIPTTTP